MARRRNFLPLAGFLVCLVAFLSYFFVFFNFPATRDVPWVNWLLFALGLGLIGAGVARAFRTPEIYKGRIAGPVFGVLSLAVVGFFLFITLMMSRQLPDASGVVQVGQKAPDFTLPDSQGRQVQLAELLAPPAGGQGKWVLLVFYRGYW